jgi:predicted Zn-dependent peptidase
MTVSSGIEADKLDVVKGAILEQLEEIRKGNISDGEFSAARKSILHGYRQLYDSPFDLQAFYSGRMAFGIDDTVESCTDKLMQVTKDDVIALANKITLDALFFIEGESGGGADEEDENE